MSPLTHSVHFTLVVPTTFLSQCVVQVTTLQQRAAEDLKQGCACTLIYKMLCVLTAVQASGIKHK